MSDLMSSRHVVPRTCHIGPCTPISDRNAVEVARRGERESDRVERRAQGGAQSSEVRRRHPSQHPGFGRRNGRLAAPRPPVTESLYPWRLGRSGCTTDLFKGTIRHNV